MISIVPYFAGAITIIFATAFYLAIQEARANNRK